jgi:phosphatidylserine/phosphatidylglycerophosphate/cardiolipin synthase-like enzyme
MGRRSQPPGARSTSRRSTSARGRLPTGWRRCWSGRTGRKSSSWYGSRRPAGWNVSPWGSNRDRLLRRLAAADRHGRLRAYWLAAAGEPDCEVNLHAKLLIVDDTFVRIGSSNLNNRSLGVDTECDLALEASEPRTRTGIALLRNTLVAEHLGRSPEEVGKTIAEHGLIDAIERLNPNGGRLRRYRIDPDDGSKEPFPGTALLDPAEPIDLDYLRRLVRDRLFPS